MSLYRFLVAVLTPLFRIFFGFKVEGLENVPDGAAIICANHTSNWDPPLIAVGLGSKHRLKFMAKVELFKAPVLGCIIRRLGAFPVERGTGDFAAVKKAVKVLRDGGKMLMFPEGRRGGGEELATFKTGLALLAVRAGAPIIPVFLSPRKKLFGGVRMIAGKPVMAEKSGAASENYRRIADSVFAEIEALGERA